ncbi:MAG: SRPBCC family protein [Cyclobacteriaceae bacterium]
MKEKKIIENTILIDAPVAKVWDALVNPEITKHYMYGCEAVSDWAVGSPLLWKGEYEGKEMIFVKGIVLEIAPNEKLKFTVIDPNAQMEDIPENYLNVTYALIEQNDQVQLTVTQDGFEDAADGEKRYQDVYNNGEGWNPILAKIKKMVEAA